MKRKFKYDNRGETSIFSVLIILAIVGVLVWQFVLPEFGYDSFFDYIEGDVDPADVTWAFKIHDNSDGSDWVRSSGGQWWEKQQAGHVYQAYIETNAPSSYSFTYAMYLYDPIGDIFNLEESGAVPLGIGAITTDTFDVGSTPVSDVSAYWVVTLTTDEGVPVPPFITNPTYVDLYSGSEAWNDDNPYFT